MIITCYDLHFRDESAGATPAGHEINDDEMDLNVSDIMHADLRVTEIKDDTSFHSVLLCDCFIKVLSQL